MVACVSSEIDLIRHANTVASTVAGVVRNVAAGDTLDSSPLNAATSYLRDARNAPGRNPATAVTPSVCHHGPGSHATK